MLFSNRLIWLLVWLIWGAKVKAFRSSCIGRYFVISDLSNSNEFLDQSNAQQRCQTNGTKLVEVASEDIQNSVINFISRVYTNQALNGLNVLTNGKRSAFDWIRLNGNGIRFLTVYEQPDISLAYGYLRSTTSGFDLFASRPADMKGGFICSGLSFCSGGVTLGGQCYKSFTDTLSWYDARNRCLVGGGDLASFDNITTNAGFNALNGSWINPSNSYWIGIRREWWTWQETNSDVKYSDWLTGHPMNDAGRINSDCLCLSTTELKWIECGCNQQLPFICILDNTVSSTYSITTPITTQTTPTSTSATTTTDTTPTSTSTTPTSTSATTTTNTTPTSTSTTPTSTSTTTTTDTTPTSTTTSIPSTSSTTTTPITVTPTTTSTSTSTSTRSTSSTGWPNNASASASADSSNPTPNATSESNGLPTPTIHASDSIIAKDATRDMVPTRRLTEVGVAVGVGVGIPLIIVIAVLAVMVARWKKKYRQAMQLFLEAYQRTSSTTEIQQSAAGGVMHELNDVVGDPYESLKPRLERTSVDRLYQSLNH